MRGQHAPKSLEATRAFGMRITQHPAQGRPIVWTVHSCRQIRPPLLWDGWFVSV